MLLETIIIAFVAVFLSITLLGHILLISAILKIWREDFGGGSRRRQPSPDSISANSEPVAHRALH